MTDPAARAPRRLAALVAISALAMVVAILGGCSGSEGEEEIDLTALIESAEPTAIVFDQSNPPQLAGVSIDPRKIEAGQCFNEYLFRDASDFVQNVTSIVGCSGPHDHEAYFRTEYPGGEAATYPIDDELERWADARCLEEFEAFVGLEYVLSALEIGAIVPTFEAWTADQDRAVVCYVFPDEGGRLLAPVGDSGI